MTSSTASPAGPRLRVLLCTVPEAHSRLESALPEHELIQVHSSYSALRILSQSTIDLVILGMAFDESRALGFFERLRADQRYRELPVVGLRGARLRLPVAPELFDFPARALGARDVIDLAAIPDDDAGRSEVRCRLLAAAGLGDACGTPVHAP